MEEKIISDVSAICDRAYNVCMENHLPSIDRMGLVTILLANRETLDYNRLLGFDDFSFIHDVTGMLRHGFMGEGFKDCFLPRCSK